MAESAPDNLVLPPGAARRQPMSVDDLIRFACRAMLLLNLLLAAFFCFLAVPWRNSMKDVFMGSDAQLPWITSAVLAIPASAYWANAAGVAAVLLLLEGLVTNRKAILVANVAALIFFILAILVLEVALRLPLISIMQTVQ